jgi:hypothetical protein
VATHSVMRPAAGEGHDRARRQAGGGGWRAWPSGDGWRACPGEAAGERAQPGGGGWRALPGKAAVERATT